LKIGGGGKTKIISDPLQKYIEVGEACPIRGKRREKNKGDRLEKIAGDIVRLKYSIGKERGVTRSYQILRGRSWNRKKTPQGRSSLTL